MIVNGKVHETGSISSLDRGFTLGDGIFETVALYNRKPFKLGSHLARMQHGATIIGIDLPFIAAEIEDGIQALSSGSDAKRGVARLTVTRGPGGRGYGIAGTGRPTWALACDQYFAPEKALYDSGATLSISSIAKSPTSPLNKIKSTSALERILMLEEAKRCGALESIALTTDGKISSGAAVNIFWVTKGEMYTPSLDCAILPGVTRNVVIEMASKDGIKVNQGQFGLDTIIDAQEILITNSLIEIMPVTTVTDIFKSKGPGAVTTRLINKYSGLIKAI